MIKIIKDLITKEKEETKIEEETEEREQSIQNLKKTITSTLEKTITQNIKTQTNTESEELRKSYLEVFEQQANKYQDNPNWWKEQFIYITKELTDKYKQYTQTNNNEYEETIISYKNKIYEFNNEFTMILIGRMPGCDISKFIILT
jgi:hypothetical protein